MSSSQPSVSASQPLRQYGPQGHDLPMACRAPALLPSQSHGVGLEDGGERSPSFILLHSFADTVPDSPTSEAI